MILRFFNKDLPLRNVLFVLGEAALIYTAVVFAAYTRFGNSPDVFSSWEILSKAALVMLVFILSLYFNDLYNIKAGATFIDLAIRLTRALGIACISLALIYFWLPALILGRGVFIISLLFCVLFVTLWRSLYDWVLKKRMFTEGIVILGTGKSSKEILDELDGARDAGYRVSALIALNEETPSPSSSTIQVFKGPADLCELVNSLGVNKIVVALDERRGTLPTRELLRCRMRGIQIKEAEALYEELTGKISVERINPSWLIFSEGFHKSTATRLLKRVSNMVFATIGLVLCAPVMGLIAVVIKLESKGPVVYRQSRCGQYDRTFELCKFRSMIDKAELATGPQWACEGDPRVTRVGNMLRKYRLDELPQMWNVLKGDMSFVGPRPERPEFVKELAEKIPYYSERHTVKPGITGWAQICYPYGASLQDAVEKLKYDLFYIKNMSFAMDLMIVFRTVKTVLSKSGSR